MFRSFQVTFMELVGSLLKLLKLKLKLLKGICGGAAAAASPQITFTIFKNLKT